MPKPYSHDDVRTLEVALAGGHPLVCPGCGAPLDRREVPPRKDVSYVRDRVWLVCSRCHANTVLDLRDP